MSDETNAESLETAITAKLAEIVAHATSKPGVNDGTGRSIQWQAYYDGLQKQLRDLIELRPLIRPYAVTTYAE